MTADISNLPHGRFRRKYIFREKLPAFKKSFLSEYEANKETFIQFTSQEFLRCFFRKGANTFGGKCLSV